MLQATVYCLLVTHLLAAPQISGGGGGAGGAGAGGAGGGAGGAGGGAGAGGAAGAAAGAAGAAMMAAGTGMMMMNPTMALFPIMLAGASFAKVKTYTNIRGAHGMFISVNQGYFIAHLLSHAPRRLGRGMFGGGYHHRVGYSPPYYPHQYPYHPHKTQHGYERHQPEPYNHHQLQYSSEYE